MADMQVINLAAFLSRTLGGGGSAERLAACFLTQTYKSPDDHLWRPNCLLRSAPVMFCVAAKERGD